MFTDMSILHLLIVFALSLICVIAIFCICDFWIRRGQIDGGPVGRWVLITGCDSGFGKQAAKHLDSIGCRVIAGCLTPAGCSEIKKVTSSQLVAIELDITSDKSVEGCYRTVSELLGPNNGMYASWNQFAMYFRNFVHTLIMSL